VYGYPSEYYSFWRNHLPEVEFPFGSIGENLTTEGLLDDNAFIGDHLQIGTAVLAIAQPRMPCSNLQFRFQLSDFIEQFVSARRHGFYLSVVQEGELESGQAMQFVHRDPERISIADVVSVYYRRAEPELAERVMSLESLAPQFKSSLAKRASA
jgi:MOSC domain-containing protein YiiM